MTVGNDNSNGKVSMARISQQLAMVIETQNRQYAEQREENKEINRKLDKLREEIHILDTKQAKLEEQQRDSCREIERLRNNSNFKDGIVGVVSVVVSSAITALSSLVRGQP